MAYPPPIPPNSRANGTGTFDNHPNDHNAISNALTDIVNELGADPSAGFADLAARIAALVPPGTIVAYGGSFAPTGYLLCNGASVSRTTYAALFAVLGTKYGEGDGSTTFTIPDLERRFPVGLKANGDGLFDVLGEIGGARNTIVIPHRHTVDAHEHGLAGHTHTIAHTHEFQDGYEVWTQGPAGTATTGLDVTATNVTVGRRWVGSTEGSSNSKSGGPSVANTTGGTSPSTDTGDVTQSGVNKNIPPYQVVNFIVKI